MGIVLHLKYFFDAVVQLLLFITQIKKHFNMHLLLFDRNWGLEKSSSFIKTLECPDASLKATSFLYFLSFFCRLLFLISLHADELILISGIQQYCRFVS